MRISDNMLNGAFLYNINNAKDKLEKLRTQIASGKKISQPSDSPSGTAKILGLNKQLSSSNTYLDNIANSIAFLQETSSSMENIQNEMQNVLVNLTQLDNASNQNTLSSFADKIDLSLSTILDSANAQSNGKYIFGGTDFSSEPFGVTSDGKAVEKKVADFSGVQKVKISQGITQKINFTGQEVFETVVSQSNNIDSTTATGSNVSSNTTIYDGGGNPYQLIVNYQKTAADTFQMTYDIQDSSGTTILPSPDSGVELKFDSSGNLDTVDGSKNKSLSINLPGNKIEFSLDLNNVTSNASATNLSFSANQKTDIFNSLMQLRDDLRAGKKPTDAQIQIVQDFNKKILDKTTEAGNVINRLMDNQDLLTNQQSVIGDLVSKEQDIDVAKAIVDLQNQDYALQVSYKISSTILPKSLMDYL